MTALSVHRPQSGRSEEDKERFYVVPSAEMQPKNGNCIVLGYCILMDSLETRKMDMKEFLEVMDREFEIKMV